MADEVIKWKEFKERTVMRLELRSTPGFLTMDLGFKGISLVKERGFSERKAY